MNDIPELPNTLIATAQSYTNTLTATELVNKIIQLDPYINLLDTTKFQPIQSIAASCQARGIQPTKKQLQYIQDVTPEIIATLQYTGIYISFPEKHKSILDLI